LSLNLKTFDFHRIPLRYVLWEVTAGCNLACLHCRASASPQTRGNEIEGDEAQKLIDSLAKLQVEVLVLTGGEPLLRKDIVWLTDYATNKSIRVRIATNGLLLTKKLCKELKDAGCFSIGIGIDGPTSKIHDKIRRKRNAFRQALRAIELVKETGIDCHVEYTAMRWNMNQVSATIELAANLGVNTFLARSAIFAGRATPNQEAFILTPPEYCKFLKTVAVERYKKQNKITINSQDPLYHLVDQLLVKKFSQLADITSGRVISGCSVGVSMAHINSVGDVGFCTFLPIKIGNILYRDFIDIWYIEKSLPRNLLIGI